MTTLYVIVEITQGGGGHGEEAAWSTTTLVRAYHSYDKATSDLQKLTRIYPTKKYCLDNVQLDHE